MSYHDLHIDEVFPKFKNDKQAWLYLGKLLDYVDRLIDKKQYDVLLAVPLSCVSYNTDVEIINKEYILKELDLSTPSVYIYHIGGVNFKETLIKSKK